MSRIAVSLTPEEAIRLGLMRPIGEQEQLKPFLQAYVKYSMSHNLGSTSFILTLLQIIYNAGRIEGIRVERNRTRKTYHQIITEEFVMKNGAYVTIICADYETAEAKKDLITVTFHPEDMVIRGNELLIPVPKNKGMGFSLNQLRNLVSPCHVAMFNLEPDESGESVRWWY